MQHTFIYNMHLNVKCIDIIYTFRCKHPSLGRPALVGLVERLFVFYIEVKLKVHEITTYGGRGEAVVC